MNNHREILPADHLEKLDEYGAQADAALSKGDYHRARYCLHWAVRLAESPQHSHLSGLAIRLKETHKAWQDIWLGAEFGTEEKTGLGQITHDVDEDQRIGPGEEIELLWVEEATDLAKAAAQKSGWDSVPWEELLSEVLRID